MSKKEWHKVQNANRWETSLGTDWSLSIARSPHGEWRIVNSPYSAFMKRLVCDDDLEAAKVAALCFVAEQARDRIESAREILAETGVT